MSVRHPPAGGCAKHPPSRRLCQTPTGRRRCQTPPGRRRCKMCSWSFSARRRLQLDRAQRRHQRLSLHREYRRFRVTRSLDFRAEKVTLVSRTFQQPTSLSGQTMLLTRFIDSVVNVPVVLQRLWPAVQTVQNIEKFPALDSGTRLWICPPYLGDSRCRVHFKRWCGSCRQLGKRQFHAARLCCKETPTRFATILITCRVDFDLVHAPWSLVVLEAVVQGLGRKLLVLIPTQFFLQPLSKGRTVHLTLKLETPLEPQTDSITAEVRARLRVELLIAP